MSVLVYIENWEGSFKKASYEAVSYASEIANKQGTTCTAVVINANDDCTVLGKYGANKVLKLSGNFTGFNNTEYAQAITEVANNESASLVVISNSNNGKMVAPLVAVNLKGGIISNAIELPSNLSPLTVKRKAFSNKAIVTYSTTSDKNVLTFTPNSFGVKENATDAAVEEMTVSVEAGKLSVVSIDKATGSIPLPEAELVVSGGRGLKGPENWHLVEDLAQTLGAGTACSKPVADMGWRPHHEHVGQTGLAINPQLYIAAGISGAIQHLAGVSSSKNIVVINTDAEAPFFKAADYGIVGDVFDVLPKLNEAIKKYKSQG
jgi:electron transfer flavoprotein alpha subunit